ncbi:CopD family protein [Pseudonocardia sp. KRD-188]|uniref:CopD family protein n=1 Tax=Pseudonocardia oceani TaxID=2792013 RepID=A0ABS6U331_9PSEU|nr:CopD family protein [Pseudonocardia oceani]MBW0088843.1 CopD family protein [Pseudonocardia oceani]MBW0120929.1 CopD family protein [Pseudonocardia oceani]MBW0126529.1 CopD family protein [Pseudonocardia oceani]
MATVTKPAFRNVRMNEPFGMQRGRGGALTLLTHDPPAAFTRPGGFYGESMPQQHVTPANLARVWRYRSALGPLVLAGTSLGLLIALWLTASAGSAIADILGLPEAGLVVRFGLPAVRVVSDIAAVATVGFLLVAAVLAAPQATGYLDIAGYRSVRVAAGCAWLWAVSAFLMVPLTVAEVLGRPVADVLALGPLTAALPLLPTSTAWLLTGVLATLIAAGCRATLTWGWAGVLLAAAVVGLLPVAATGHSAVGGSHDLATDSLMIHIVAAAVWVGGLIAVLSLAARPSPNQLGTVLPRFSMIAAWCWGLMALSGLANLAVRIPLTLPNLLSDYGVIAMAKTASLLLLGVLGYLHRRTALAPAVQGDRRALLRLGAGEVLLMLATIGLAVGLGRTPPRPQWRPVNPRAPVRSWDTSWPGHPPVWAVSSSTGARTSSSSPSSR